MPRKGEKKNGKVWDGKRWVYPSAVHQNRISGRVTSAAPVGVPDEAWNDLKRTRAIVDRQRGRLTAMGAEVPDEGKEKNPSILSRTFDVLSRPMYASANFFSDLVDEEGGEDQFGEGSITRALSGAWQGLQGKDKTTFSDVLEEGGLKGKPAAALGFVLDVALDPSSYTGVGLVGKLNKLDDVAKIGSKAMGLAADAVKTESALHKAGKSTVTRRAIDEALKTARQSNKPFKVKEVVEDSIVSNALKIAKTEETRLLAMNKPKLGIKALGREVAIPGTGGIARGLQGAGRGLRENTPLRNLSPTALFPGGVNQSRLQHLGVSGLTTKRQLAEWSDALKGTTKAERTLIVNYMRNGTKLPSPELRTIADEFRALMDEMAETEVKLFGNTKLVDIDPATGKIAKGSGAYDPNYVPDVWRKGSHLTSVAKLGGPAEAIKKGYRQVDDIADVLAYKVNDFNREMGKYNLAQDLVAQFGVMPVAGKVGKTQKALFESGAFVPGTKLKGANPYIPGDAHFDPKIATAIKTLGDFMTSDEQMSRFFRGFDNMQGKWKFLATVPNPGFHTRNLLSDMWTNSMDGLLPNPTSLPYRAAWDEMVAPTIKNFSLNPRKVKTIDAGTAGKRDIQEIVQAYDDLGLRSGYYRAEAGGVVRTGTGRLKTPVRKLRDVSEAREDFTRFAHFVDSVIKNGKRGKNWNEATQEAAEAVRTFNFDYNDFTPFEAKVMKRMIPFYSWMRKNVPLQLSLLATRPGRVAVAPKGIRALQGFLGVEGEEPMPGLGNVLPLWVDEAGGFLTRQGEFGERGPGVVTPDFLPVADLGNYTEGLDQMLDPSLSISDRLELFGKGPLANVVQQTAPALRVPFELAIGTQAFGSRDIKDYGEYLRNQALPPYRYTAGVMENDTSGSLSERLLRTYGGLGTRTIGPETMTSELRRQQDRYDAMVGPAKARALEEYRKRYGLAP